jgi:hypothetical protein
MERGTTEEEERGKERLQKGASTPTLYINLS